MLAKHAAAWLFAPGSAVPLALLRIGTALLFLIKLGLLRGAWMDVYGPFGLVPWTVTRAELPPALPHLIDLAVVLAPLGVSATQTVYAVITLQIVALSALLLGVLPRTAAVVAFVANYLLMRASAGLLYGMEHFGHVALGYLVFMPSGDALSLPRWLRAEAARESAAAGCTHKLLQVHMCIVYTSSGFEKALGADWWNGEAIWRALTLPDFAWLDASWLASAPTLATLLGWSVLLIEAGYALGMAFAPTRKLWLCLIVSMHLTIAIALQLWLFAAIMIVLNTAAFGARSGSDSRSPTPSTWTWSWS
jgi:hypothetical protein